MDGDHSNMGSMKLPHSHSTPAGVDGGSRTPPTTPKKGGKMLAVRIQMLDDSVTMFQVQAKALGRVLFEQVCKQLHLLEADYFGLEYQEPNGTRYWLDLEKPLSRQVGLTLVDPLLRFCVKFYTPDPAQLEEEFTRYLYCLQIKRDLCQGLLQCNDNTAALMASYIVQAECGDYVIEDYPDHTYLSTYKFTPNQDQELERRIMENHKKHAGQSPAEADLNLLETSRRCELYGMKMHPAKDHEGVPLNLAVAHMGIVVFQNYTKINTFSWAKIRKISFKRKRFLVKLHPEGYGYYKDTVEFFFEGRNDCKNFWKKCVENHGFFRCSMVKRVPRQKTRVLSRGSSFRYSGKTQKQIVEFVRENYVKRQTFQRSQSFRHSNSVHSSVANVGTSLSAHPLLPLGDNAVVGTQASLSCGSVHLSSERRRPSPPLHAADIHDPLPTSPSPPLTTSLSPPTSLTSSPQHFYPHEEEQQHYQRHNASPGAYRRHTQGQPQSNTTLSIQTTARRKSHGSVASNDSISSGKNGVSVARGKADGKVSSKGDKYSSKTRYSTSNDSLSAGKGSVTKTAASKTRYSTSNDSLSSGNKTSKSSKSAKVSVGHDPMESHYSTSNDSLSYGNTTTTSLRSKSESSYDKSKNGSKKPPSISQGNLKSSFSTSNDSLSYGTAGGNSSRGKSPTTVYGSKSKSSSSSYGSLSQSSSKVSKVAPSKPKREQILSPTQKSPYSKSIAPVRKAATRSKSPKSPRGYVDSPQTAVCSHITTLPKAKHVSRYTWQRSASCRDLHVDTKFEESAKPVETVDKRGYYDTVYMQDRKQDSPVTKYDENLQMRYKTCTKKKSTEESLDTRIYSSSYPGTTSSLSTESGGNDEGMGDGGGSDCVLITAIGGDGSLEEMALSHDDLSHDSYELLEEEEAGRGGGSRSYEGTRSCSLDSEPETADEEMAVGEVFQMDVDEGEGVTRARHLEGRSFVDEPLRDFRPAYEDDPRQSYVRDFRPTAYDRPKYDRPKFGLESSEESGSGVDSNLDPEHVDYGECRSDEGSMSSREGGGGCVGFIYNEYGEKIMVKGFKDVDRGLATLTFGGYEPKVKLEVTKMASDDSKSSYENVKDISPKQTQSHFTEYNAKCEPGLVIGFDSPREGRKLHSHNPIERAKSDPFSRPKRHMLTHQKSIDLTPADSCSDLETHDSSLNVLGATTQSEFNIPYTLHKRHAMNGTAPDSLRSCEPIYAEIADDLKKSSFDSTRHAIYAEISDDASKRDMDSPKQGIYAEITDELKKSGIDLSKNLGIYTEIGDLKKSSTDTDLAKRDASLTICDDLNKSLPDCFARADEDVSLVGESPRVRNEPIYAEIDDLSDRETDNRINLEDFPPINEPIYAQVTKAKKSPKKPLTEKQDQSVPVEKFQVVLPPEVTVDVNVTDRTVPIQNMGSSSSIPDLQFESSTPPIEINDIIDLANLEPLGEDRWNADDTVPDLKRDSVELQDQKVPSFDEAALDGDRKLLVHNLSLEMKSSESFRKLDRKVLSAEERGSKMVKSPSKTGKGTSKQGGGKTLGVRRVKSAEKRSPNISRESSVAEIINMDEERKIGSTMDGAKKVKKVPKTDVVKAVALSKSPPPKSPKALKPEEVCVKHSRSPPKSPRSLKSGETKFVFISDSKSPPKSPSSLKPDEIKSSVYAESKSPPKSPKVREREGTIFVYNISDARSPPVSPNTLKPDEVSAAVYVESKSPPKSPKSPKVREKEGTIFVYNISDSRSPPVSPNTLKPSEIESSVLVESKSPPKSPKVREIDGTKFVFITESPPKSPKLLINDEVIITHISDHKSPPRSPKDKKTHVPAKTTQKVPAITKSDEESSLTESRTHTKTSKVPSNTRPASVKVAPVARRAGDKALSPTTSTLPPVVAPSLQRKRDKSPVLFARGRLGISEGSAFTALAQSVSPSSSRRAKSLDAPVVSVKGLPPADSFSSNDDTVESEDVRITERKRAIPDVDANTNESSEPKPEPLESVREENEAIVTKVEPVAKTSAEAKTLPKPEPKTLPKPEPKPKPKLVDKPKPVDKPPIPKKPSIPPKPVVKVTDCTKTGVDLSKEKRNFEPVDLPTEADSTTRIVVSQPEIEDARERETEQLTTQESTESDVAQESELRPNKVAHQGSLHKESSGEYERFDSIDLPSECQDGNYFVYPDVTPERPRQRSVDEEDKVVSVILEESEENIEEEYPEDVDGSPDVWVSVEDLREVVEPSSPPYETACLPEDMVNIPEDLVNIPEDLVNIPEDLVDIPENIIDIPDVKFIDEDDDEVSDEERVSDFEERGDTSAIDLVMIEETKRDTDAIESARQETEERYEEEIEYEQDIEDKQDRDREEIDYEDHRNKIEITYEDYDKEELESEDQREIEEIEYEDHRVKEEIEYEEDRDKEKMEYEEDRDKEYPEENEYEEDRDEEELEFEEEKAVEDAKREDDNYNEELMKSIVESCLEEERRELEGRDEVTEELKSFGKEEEPLYDSVKDDISSMIEEATVSYEMEEGDYAGRDKAEGEGEIEEDEVAEERGERSAPPVRIERVKSEEEPSTSSSFALPRRELSSTWRPFLLESSGSSSLEEGFFPPDDSAHLADEEETSSTSNNHPDDFRDDVDFPTGFGYPVGLSGAEMIIGYGSPFSLSRTLSRISERSTTSEQERSDFDDDSTKPSSRSPSMDDESLLSSDHQPSLSSDPPSTGAALGDEDPDSPKTPEGAVFVPPPPISDDEWPSPPNSGSPFNTPVVSHVETFYMEIQPEEAARTVLVDPCGDESSTDENHTLQDDDLQLSSSAGTLEDTVRLAVRSAGHFGSLSEDTSMGGLSLSDWSGNTVRHVGLHRMSYSSAKSDDTSLGAGDLKSPFLCEEAREKSPSRAKSDTCLDDTTPKKTSQRTNIYYTSKSLTNVDTFGEGGLASSSERPMKVVRQKSTPYYSRADSLERSTSESTSLECGETKSRSHTPSAKLPVARPKYPYYSSAKSPPSDASSSSVEASAERQRVTKRRKSQPKRRHRVTVEMEVRDGHIVEIPSAVASTSQPKLREQSSTSSSDAKVYLSKQSSV